MVTLPLSQTLKKLISEASQLNPGTAKRQKTLHQVYILVMESKKLWRDPHPSYADALQDMWEYCFTNLEDYDPATQEVTTWLNDNLKRRFLRRYKDRAQRDLHRHISCVTTEDGSVVPISELIPSRQDSSESLDRILVQTLEWIESDPDQQMKQCFFRKRKEINVQELLLRRLPPNCQDWSSIAAEFSLNQMEASDLPKWYSRYCKPFLRNYARQQGFID